MNPSLPFSSVARTGVAVVGVVAAILALGPFRKQLGTNLSHLRQRVLPQHPYVDEYAVPGRWTQSTGSNVRPVATRALTDRVPSDAWLGTALGCSTSQTPPFTVVLNPNGGPVDLMKMGIIAGTKDGGPAKASPHHLLLIPYAAYTGPAGKAKTIGLADTSNFQQRLYLVRHVRRVEVFVCDTFDNGSGTQTPYVIDEIELFQLK
jgi:hypothetical protein